MLTGEAPVAMAGFLLAHCVGPEKYFTVVDAVYREVGPLLETTRGRRGAQSAGQGGRVGGVLSEQQFDTCVSNNDAILAEQTKTDKTAKDHSIDATPTFVVNGKVLPDHDIATLQKAIADAQAGK